MATGLAVDGGRKLGALSEARDIADNAARAGAQMIDEDTYRSTGIPAIDPAAATATRHRLPRRPRPHRHRHRHRNRGHRHRHASPSTPRSFPGLDDRVRHRVRHRNHRNIEDRHAPNHRLHQGPRRPLLHPRLLIGLPVGLVALVGWPLPDGMARPRHHRHATSPTATSPTRSSSSSSPSSSGRHGPRSRSPRSSSTPPSSAARHHDAARRCPPCGCSQRSSRPGPRCCSARSARSARPWPHHWPRSPRPPTRSTSTSPPTPHRSTCRRRRRPPPTRPRSHAQRYVTKAGDTWWTIAEDPARRRAAMERHPLPQPRRHHERRHRHHRHDRHRAQRMAPRRPRRRTIGPTRTSEPTADAAPTMVPENGGRRCVDSVGRRVVVVEKGDHFWGIADEALTEAWGRAPTDAELAPYWADVVAANEERLLPPGDPNLIYPDQTFVLPDTPPNPDLAPDLNGTAVIEPTTDTTAPTDPAPAPTSAPIQLPALPVEPAPTAPTVATPVAEATPTVEQAPTTQPAEPAAAPTGGRAPVARRRRRFGQADRSGRRRDRTARRHAAVHAAATAPRPGRTPPPRHHDRPTRSPRPQRSGTPHAFDQRRRRRRPLPRCGQPLPEPPAREVGHPDPAHRRDPRRPVRPRGRSSTNPANRSPGSTPPPTTPRAGQLERRSRRSHDGSRNPRRRPPLRSRPVGRRVDHGREPAGRLRTARRGVDRRHRSTTSLGFQRGIIAGLCASPWGTEVRDRRHRHRRPLQRRTQPRHRPRRPDRVGRRDGEADAPDRLVARSQPLRRTRRSRRGAITRPSSSIGPAADLAGVAQHLAPVADLAYAPLAVISAHPLAE